MKPTEEYYEFLADNNGNQYTFYWYFDVNIMNLNFYFKFAKAYRKNGEANWKPISDLIIYDRFGSRLSINNVGKPEFKLTDVGQKHFNLTDEYFINKYFINECHRSIIDAVDKVIEKDFAENRRQTKEIESLFPPKNYMKFK